MGQFKCRVEVAFVGDTDEYPTPADGKLNLQIKDDIIEAIETSLPFEITGFKLTRSGIKNEQPD